MKTHKEGLQQQQGNAEQRLHKQHTEYTALELRKFSRRKLLQYHQLAQELLKAVSVDDAVLVLRRVSAIIIHLLCDSSVERLPLSIDHIVKS